MPENIKKENLLTEKEESHMLKVSDLEEKKLIVAFSMARDNTHVGLENVWRRCVW